jgi:hypothetical protein
VNKALKPPEAFFIKASMNDADLLGQQDMWVYPGQILLGCCRAPREGIKNNCEYQVTAVSVDGLSIGEKTLPLEAVPKLLRLSHARTYASCQGLTFSATCRLLDADHPRFTRTHLFVAISRNRLHANIHVA